MLIDTAAQVALFIKPAIPSIWSVMMLYQLGYINMSKIIRIRNRAAVLGAYVCRVSAKLFMLWLFMKQFIFVGMNMHRFAGSDWMPLIEAIFH